jgi:hypothetical protein
MLKKRIFGTITMLVGVILLFNLIGCDSTSDNGNKTTKFEGVWNHEDGSTQFIFAQNYVLVKYRGTNEVKGTFTFSETELVFTFTHAWRTNVWTATSISAKHQYNFINNDTIEFVSAETNGVSNPRMIGIIKRQ